MKINFGYVIIDMIFGVIAALVAFMITYNEYVHHYPTKKEPTKLALNTAVFTFIVFLVLGVMGIIALNMMG